MSRILQLFSLLLAAIAVMVGWRIIKVARIATPQFQDPPQLASQDGLRIPPHKVRGDAAMINAIVDGNIFDPQRGYQAPTADAAQEAPLPPPTNVVLNGIMVVDGKPVAIVTDTKQGNTQLSVRVGEMVDAYEVGKIEGNAVTLLGPGGKKFAVALDVVKAKQGRPTPGRRPPVSRTTVRPTPSRTAPGRTPTPPARAAAARAAAARAAAARRAAGRNGPTPGHAVRGRPQPAGAARGQAPPTPDPAQERLKALKAIRQAAGAR